MPRILRNARKIFEALPVDFGDDGRVRYFLMTDPNEKPAATDEKCIVTRTLSEGVAGLTTIATMKRGDIALSAGHLLQGLLSGRFLDEFANEWQRLKERGRIKEDYDATPQAEACLRELLDYLDSEIPVPERMKILKRVFLVTATESASDREDLVPQQLMQICRGLTSGEILVLNAAYELSKGNVAYKFSTAVEWLDLIAEKSRLKHRELVEDHDESLMKKRLLTGRQHGDGSGVVLGKHFRLSDLGYHLCSFIAKYDDLSADTER